MKTSEILEITANSFYFLTKSCQILRKAWNLRNFLTIFKLVFENSRKKKAGSPLQKQEFQVKSFGLAHIRTRRVAVYVHDHVHMLAHIMLCAHMCRVC